jgi:hypothetical protein
VLVVHDGLQGRRRGRYEKVSAPVRLVDAVCPALVAPPKYARRVTSQTGCSAYRPCSGSGVEGIQLGIKPFNTTRLAFLDPTRFSGRRIGHTRRRRS